MIYNNPYNQEIIQTCSMCGKTYKIGHVSCAVMHYGVGCCHYGDTEVTTKPIDEPSTNQPIEDK